MIRCLNASNGTDWNLYHGDCVDVVRQMPDNAVDLSVFSPPFANLYTYSDTPRDMGNCASDGDFLEHYLHLLTELFRVTRPGRCCVVHCAHTYNFKYRDGEASVRDFPGELVRAHVAAGFAYQGRITIWKDPVTEMQRTKSHRLLYKNFKDDSTVCAPGSADYLLLFRKMPGPGDESAISKVKKNPEDYPVTTWQEWASPVWMTVDQGNTLNVAAARGEDDERHMCPLQLDVIERVIEMWSNRGDVVLSPFAGVGSEGVMSLRLGRRFVGVELKAEYFGVASNNLTDTAGGRQTNIMEFIFAKAAR